MPQPFESSNNYTYSVENDFFENYYVRYEELEMPGPAFVQAGAYGTTSLLYTAGGSPAHGHNDAAIRTTLTQLGSSNWIYVTHGANRSSGITSDGSLWTWGIAATGTSGAGNLTNTSSPVKVGTLTDWRFTTIGVLSFTAHAIKKDNTLWGWGDNAFYGAIGDGTVLNKSSPIQIGGLNNWRLISAGNLGPVAIKTDNTLWAWGGNTNGQLGQGNITHRSSPVQIGTAVDWKQVATRGSTVIALTEAGIIYTWGWGAAGQLAIGTVTSRSTPAITTINANERVKYISSYLEGIHWITNAGRLYGCGFNTSGGPLGDGTLVNKSVGTAVGSLTDWNQIKGGSIHNVALKTNGTMWAWGRNDNGNLGQGDTVHRSSPIQVGALTDWKFINQQASSYNTSAIRSPY